MSMFASRLPRRHANYDAWAFLLLAALIVLAPLIHFDAARAADPTAASLEELPPRVTAVLLDPDGAGVPGWATAFGPHDARIADRVAAIEAEAEAERERARRAATRNAIGQYRLAMGYTGRWRGFTCY
ncbi:MAG: hypothetical protein H6739_33785 [Alphaproteobacteria bacterium]|nr:hypothetical protein [Alphaproteobacteria bacterium]